MLSSNDRATPPGEHKQGPLAMLNSFFGGSAVRYNQLSDLEDSSGSSSYGMSLSRFIWTSTLVKYAFKITTRTICFPTSLSPRDSYTIARTVLLITRYTLEEIFDVITYIY